LGAPPDTAYMATPCRLDTLATGAALAVIASRPPGLQRLARTAPIALAASAALLALLLAVLAAWPAAPVEGAIARSQRPAVQTIGFTLLCIGWGALLVWIVTAPERARIARLFRLPPLQSLGRYSYAIYLVHLPVALGVHQWLGQAAVRRHFAAAQLGSFALTLAISYSLALLSWFALEEPMLRLKRRFPYRLAS
jgi:peptidoglycan/LPS O-acetylase OafA/YrhL